MIIASTWITKQLVFNGAVSGLVTGLVAMGIVLIYRATRVINFAVGNMGLVGASLLALMTVRYGVPFWVAAAVALVLGTLFAAAVELVVVRRLFRAPRVIVLVGTIGIAELALAVVTAFPKVRNEGARYPVAAVSTWRVLGVNVAGPQLAIICVVPLVALGLTWFLTNTVIGKSVKASAGNADLARLSGISPKAVSTLVWSIAGLLSTVSLILIAGQAGTATDLTTLGPDTLVRALAAAVIAGMASFRRAVAAGIVIGVGQAVVGFNYLDQAGLIDFLILLAVLAAVWFQSRERPPATTFAFTPKPRPVPERLRELWWVRHMDKFALLVLGAAAVILPIVVTQPSRNLLYTTILAYAICASSLTVLTGWGGQLSLGQMAFGGIGALTAASLTRGMAIDIGWHHWRMVNVVLDPVPFWVSIAIAAAVTAALAGVIGLGSLRVRGLLLAVTTFAFALAAQQYLYRRPVLSGHSTATVPFPRGHLFGLATGSQRTYYYIVLAVLGGVLVVLSRLRRSGIGRATIAVRDNSTGAAAYTVRTSRTQLRAFAVAGGIAGLGGALLAGAVQTVPFTERFFLVNDSLVLVSIVVIGGLGSITGPVLGALWVVGLPAFAPTNQLVALLTSSLGLLVLLLYFPGGFVDVGYRIREAALAWAERRAGPMAEQPRGTLPVPSRREERAQPGGREPVLVATDVRVHFGGITAVDDVTIRVLPDETVGVIGANGAGKTTLMNAIGGFVASTGSVKLLGDEVARTSPEHRALLGLGRTFQAATLFPELTVRETVEVALERRGRTGIVGTVLMLPHARAAERAKRSEAAELLDFLGLGRYADHYIKDLSTGTRRIVELAGLLALDARVLCLDEPTAGVAQRETEAFGPLITEIRRELGASMLVIEHDMPFIMGISDRVYCLETGRVISEGPPEAVRADPLVIASYLGTDERAIARSGTEPAVAHAAQP